MTIRTLLLTVSAVVLTACATSTPYQAASAPGGFDGFSQTMIENNRARISFGGNSLTDRETVENYLLYRAAEMAVERGFDTFTLNTRDVEEKTRLTTTGSSLHSGFYDPYFGYSFYRPRYGWSNPYAYSRFDGFRNRRGFGRAGFYNGFGRGYYDPFFNDFDVREITKYRATAEVKFGHGSYSADKNNVFKAKEVLQNLGPTIIYPEQKS